MILDAVGLQPVLTPELALSVVEKEIKKKGWLKFEVTDIRLVYTPFWLFSFDATNPQGQATSAKTALNAYSGELNDFAAVLLERPFKKTRSTQEGVECEVEPTALGASEVKEATRAKVAAQLGLKTENVSTSAFTKYYIPFYRVWVDVEKETYKIDVDSCLGAPLGLEAVPERKKGFGEKASETLEKMKSPKGLLELGKSISGLGKPSAPSAVPGAEAPGPLGISKTYWILGGAIIILLIIVFARSTRVGGGATVSCSVNEDFLGAPFLGIGLKPIEPIARGKMLFVRGKCEFLNPTSEEVLAIAQVRLLDARSKQILASQLLVAQPKPGVSVPAVKEFELNWTDTGAKSFSFEFQKMS